MPEQTTQRMAVEASPQRVWDVLTDFGAYPSWARGLKSVDVVARDQEGRGLEVAFRAAAMGRSTSYTLRYDYSRAPHVLRWALIEGDITRLLDGSYELIAVNGNPHRTEIVYNLTVDLKAPLPGFVKRRAQAHIIHTALQDLRDHLER